MAACSADTVRPLADRVSVEDPETVPYDVEFTYFTPEQAGTGASEAEIAEKVQEAVDQYNAWQCAKLGRDINYPLHPFSLPKAVPPRPRVRRLIYPLRLLLGICAEDFPA